MHTERHLKCPVLSIQTHLPTDKKSSLARKERQFEVFCRHILYILWHPALVIHRLITFPGNLSTPATRL